MSELAVATLSHDEARSLTDEVKGDAERLWRKLVELYDGGAHLALGYPSWGAYFETEFGGKSSHAYRVLDAGRVARALDSPIGERPANEAQARELAPLLDDPEKLRETWAEVVELHPEPTAADVREVVQSRMGVHYSSATGDWETPQDLFDLLDAEFGFDLDVCATAKNAKCATYFTPAEDGLAQPWTGVCWMNPPYGDAIRDWVEKAWAAAQSGATVVCLVPARVDTGWWWDLCRHGEIRFLRGRLRFGGGDTGAPFPSAVVIFPRDPRVVWWERAA
ncbi:MAG: phage N-6-adenine-methyltransferase [Gemmatimonadaceae bacterium]|nr:phage N-6-adenine-methyltransferase [Gemmatimonadaceae bacterium]